MEVESKTKDILSQALSYGASDVHFVPKEHTAVIRFRIDGQLTEMEQLSIKSMLKLIGHLKFVSGMDVGERRRPQNSSLELPLSSNICSLRLSTFPSSFHETLAVRLFPHETQQTLEQLCLFPSQANQLLQLTRVPHGLILICGATGSGKTTTLYTLLHTSLYMMKQNIITLEDPVEKKHDQFLQMEINERAGITYSEGLRNLLRHDPDVIMIGEIRDKETAQLAVRAALTGHLVLSTLHSSSTLGALRRLRDLGITEMELYETLQGIIAQRLVQIVCPYCGENCHHFCRKYRTRRRSAVFEILAGAALTEAISQGPGIPMPAVKTLMGLVNKGVLLGYIGEKELFRYRKGIENENQGVSS
ncbi:competence protein ComGA [Evansella caseinilytica]|uniref:Competence protein ComGA n=1 Tax=Evansella caseinilytica TaxID=1503961 RepID=A0A1H3KTK9_9BACI|nr:competence type IV pilus ATPase ComGA [Evansella caseinilytica]SDY55088.1 competence protein ComGA [Evansella caseinilytica]